MPSALASPARCAVRGTQMARAAEPDPRHGPAVLVTDGNEATGVAQGAGHPAPAACLVFGRVTPRRHRTFTAGAALLRPHELKGRMSRTNGNQVGRLLLIGGAEDQDEHDATILSRLVEISGGEEARILVCTSPSADVEGTFERYRRVFTKLGVAEVLGAPIDDRPDADLPEALDAVQRATAVFFTGGDQLRLTSLIGGTHFSEAVRDRLFRDGLTVAGTSAGAAAMSSVLVGGGGSGSTVRRADVPLNPGLGLWRDTVVDTHFDQRGRVSRLLAVVAHNPQVLGIGIDENTAVEVELGERFTVIGEHAAMVFDGHITHTSAPKARDHDVLAVTDTLIHVLPAGYGFDLQCHRPLRPDQSVVEPPTADTSAGSWTAELGVGD